MARTDMVDPRSGNVPEAGPPVAGLRQRLVLESRARVEQNRRAQAETRDRLVRTWGWAPALRRAARITFAPALVGGIVVLGAATWLGLAVWAVSSVSPGGDLTSLRHVLGVAIDLGLGATVVGLGYGSVLGTRALRAEMRLRDEHRHLSPGRLDLGAPPTLRPTG